MINFFKRINWFFVSQVGLDVKRFFYFFLGIPKFICNFIFFSRNYSGVLKLQPCLTDWYDEAGYTNSEYFWQDLLVAQLIYQTNSFKHIDIGSRFDGFVTHVASFRLIEVFDIRPIRTEINNVIFNQCDLIDPFFDKDNYCDSISCLHALEHFGLGRYGDPLNPLGYKSALKNISKMTKSEGIFYLSVPIGKPCVYFNAHQIFDVYKLLDLLNSLGFILEKFYYFNNNKFTLSSDLYSDLFILNNLDYTLALFILVKE